MDALDGGSPGTPGRTQSSRPRAARAASAVAVVCRAAAPTPPDSSIKRPGAASCSSSTDWASVSCLSSGHASRGERALLPGARARERAPEPANVSAVGPSDPHDDALRSEVFAASCDTRSIESSTAQDALRQQTSSLDPAVSPALQGGVGGPRARQGLRVRLSA